MIAFIDRLSETDTEAVEIFRRLWEGQVKWLDRARFKMGRQLYRVFEADRAWCIEETEMESKDDS